MAFIQPGCGPFNPEPSYDAKRAAFLWDAHSALLKAVIGNPTLRDNPVWTMLRQDVYEALMIESGKS